MDFHGFSWIWGSKRRFSSSFRGRQSRLEKARAAQEALDAASRGAELSGPAQELAKLLDSDRAALRPFSLAHRALAQALELILSEFM